MNPLNIALVIAFAGIWFVYRYADRAMKAHLAQEQAIRDAKLKEEHDAWVRKIQTRGAELKTPSQN